MTLKHIKKNGNISIVTSFVEEEEEIVKTNRKHMSGGLRARCTPKENGNNGPYC